MAAPSEDISAVAPTRASGEKVAETVGPLSILPVFSSGNSMNKTDSHATSNEDLNRVRSGAAAVESDWYSTYRWAFHSVAAAVVTAWWICGIVRKETRDQWIVTTFITWTILLSILFTWVDSAVIGNPIGAVWTKLIGNPWMNIPRRWRFVIGWVGLLALILGSAFGTQSGGQGIQQRAIPVFGIIVFQGGLYATSMNRRAIPWHTVIVGLGMQQIIALFVLKTKAGYDTFSFVATTLSTFFNFSLAGVNFFFSADIGSKHYFAINVSAVIVFFVAFVYLLYHWGFMQFAITKIAWLFNRAMDVSGVEAIVASASPFIGQGESACLVKPYMAAATQSEIHVVMTSGFSTISGSVFAAYVSLGMPPQYLITASIMSIPASLSISKMRCPELGNPLTKGGCVKLQEKEEASSSLHAFSNGAWFGLRIAGLIVANLLVVLSAVACINSVMTWVGQFFGIQALTLDFILQYLFYPLAWLMGVPSEDCLAVATLLGKKFVANEFVAYEALLNMQTAGSIGNRSFIIAVFALCGFANLSSLAIQLGVLSGLAPNQKATVARVGFSALLCGFLSTMQTAALAGLLL